MFFKNVFSKKTDGRGNFNSGKISGNWKGNMAGNRAIHKWVKSRLIKPCICPKCNKRPPVDMHNINGKYARKLGDWIYLCRSCHVKLHKHNKIYKSK